MSAAEQGGDRAARLQRAIEAKRAGARPRVHDLPPRPAGEAATLSDLQRGLWFEHQMHPESPAYNLCRAYRLDGPLDLARLEQAVRAVVARHRLLRSTFQADGDTVLQIVHETMPIPIERITTEDGAGLVRLTREAAHPFDLDRGPLMRLTLIDERSGHDRFFLLALHHILADERALERLWREIADGYERGPSDAAVPPAQYDDYVYWLRRNDPRRRHEDLEYWRRRLDPLPDDLRLPFERSSTAEDSHQSGRGRLIERTPRASFQAGVRRLAAAVEATPFMVYAFAFRLLLHRYTEGQRIAFATPVSIRSHPATADMIGYFLNPVVIYGQIDEQQPVAEAVARFSRDLTDALGHASAPFDAIAAQVAPPRRLDRHPVFQTLFVYQEIGPPPMLGDARLEPLTLDLGASKFDLTLFVTERAGSLQTAVEYRADRFDEVWMRALLDHCEVLFEQLPADHGRRVADVPLLGTAEEARLADWERGPVLEGADAPPVPQQILDQVRRHPQSAAVICDGVGQDYAGLETAARAIAGALVASGVKPGDRVAVFLDRSIHLAAGLLASHLAGAAYVPLDPAYPQARNLDVLEDAEVAAVLTASKLSPRLPAGPWRTIAVDTIDTRAAPVAPQPDLPPDLRAYILYTSGSTGHPKGVVITQDNLRLSTVARLQVYATAPTRFLLLPSVAFDSSVAGIFWTLATGGTLVVPTDTEVRDVRALARLVEEAQVTTMLLVPSLYAGLLGGGAERLRGLHTVIVAGESCSSRLVEEHFRLLPDVRLFNEYGPTEATVWAAFHEITPDDAARAVAIGRPVPGVRVEVRDGWGRRVPAGIPGDGWIVGPTVASGYWRRKDLTTERFVGDSQGHEPAHRRYRTGDRMVWTADGRLLFLGRDDDQIKLRGFRIEPGEIESALVEQCAFAEAAVVARPPSRGATATDAGSTQLVAFVSKGARAIESWRRELAARLPDHMIPSRVVELPRLPRLPNGKVDRRRLHELPFAEARRVPASEPTSTLEQGLVSLWEGLLGRDGIGTSDNFFELGGHSLLVIQMVAAIERDLEVTLGAADVFQSPSVRDLARRIEQRGGPTAPAYQQLFPIQPTGRKTPFIMAAPHFFTEGLATRFRGERPVYGVRGVALRAEGNRGRWPSLTDLAEEVVDELQRRFPEGPYILAGYSFGAWLAIEAARVLERRGVSVHRLYVIAPMPVDVYRFGPFRVRIHGLRQPLADLGVADVLFHYLRSNHPFTRGPYGRGRQWVLERPRRRLLALVGAMRRRAGLPLSPRLLQADVRAERFRLHVHYRPGPVSAPTVFFNPVGPATDSAATWRPYFQGPLTVLQIPDPHDEASVDAARKLILERLHELED